MSRRPASAPTLSTWRFGVVSLLLLTLCSLLIGRLVLIQAIDKDPWLRVS